MGLFSDKPFTLDRIVRLLITLGVVYLVFLLVRTVQDVLIPFAIAALLAYLIQPLVNILQVRVRIKNRLVAILISLFLIATAFVLFSLTMVPVFVKEIRHVGELVTKMANDAKLNEKVAQYLPEDMSAYVAELAQREDIQAFFNTEKFGEIVINTLRTVVPGVWGLFSGALDIVIGVVGLFIILLYLIFILLDYDTIMEGWKDLLHPSYRTMMIEVVEDFTAAMRGYFRAQALIASICGVLFAVGFEIIDLPLGIVIGLFIGLLNMVPYLQTLGLLPCAFFALVHSLETGRSFWIMMLLVLIVFAVVQAIQDGFLVPKIMGDVTGLNPAVMLLSLSIWGKLLGMLGLIIALPMTFLVSSYYHRFLRFLAKRHQEAMDGETAGQT
ncbi:AI-2E family transporter [Acanthopleuribacter pedis]|uniref:AI-2E family transporter n=1 Tax=Acanthopleuribacter pedis TaxID=442870 RepID=A0A8J7QHM5_9BACT|nr:AI-2E family transporter [Acanthopleuribacter pedis]MBO1322635.1 AI-2E family transporter [Acanthopleuribacter pedis]